MKTQTDEPVKADIITRIELIKITYKGLSKHPLGGWDYTKKLVGVIESDRALDCEECLTLCCQHASGGTHFRMEERQWDGRFQTVFSGSI